MTTGQLHNPGYRLGPASRRSLLLVVIGWTVGGLSGIAAAHQGPDPIAHWFFTSRSVENQTLKARLGPDGSFRQKPTIVRDAAGEYARFDGRSAGVAIGKTRADADAILPKRDLTVSAWVAIDKPERWGGLVGLIQDNGPAETGWLLGYDERHFTFALSSNGADDGDGRMTYLTGKTPYEPGRFYHVAAVYDGETMQLYVNGKLDATSTEQSGDILYPERGTFVLGAYEDDDESYPLQGRIREISLYDLAARDAWVEHEYGHGRRIAELPVTEWSEELALVVKPYLQYGTMTTMTVMWQTTKSAAGTVHYGETAECRQTVAGPTRGPIHEVRIENLQPATQYFYKTSSQTESGETVESDVSTFVTAVPEDRPFAFAVISDTQRNPKVTAQLAKLAWAQRPSFLLHPGDLVDDGTSDRQWTDEFFPSLHELISRVPFYPVLGNHERNSKNYYAYMSLPDPEYYYEFRFGNAHFFMIDTNQEVGPASEQYRWLDEALGRSNATWKFVCHHHPPYSSDEDDYGNLWKTNRSTHGDLRARQLATLYDKHRVDIVWSGHIHSYERTWPLRDDKPVEKEGTVYMITGGGGGSLESAGPIRPAFQNNVRHGFHYVMVAINGGTLEFKAFTIDDRLFDTLTITKTDEGRVSVSTRERPQP